MLDSPLPTPTMRFSSTTAAVAVLLTAATAAAQQQQPTSRPARASFAFPCDGYVRGLHGRGNFGVLIKRSGSAFSGTYHLAEDVWLPPGTTVRSIGDGFVRYSDFSPTWKDKRGRIHWNLGNVIVIEHALEPVEEGLESVCSVYVHLGAKRRVQTGDKVTRSQVLGVIGADRSEENGRYPAHLHFGIHRGPYYQIAPSWRRDLEESARTTGLLIGPNRFVGEITIQRTSKTSVLVRSKQGDAKVGLSLLVGSTHPGRKPADIMGWCSGYGDKHAVQEWLRPSSWLSKHGAR